MIIIKVHFECELFFYFKQNIVMFLFQIKEEGFYPFKAEPALKS